MERMEHTEQDPRVEQLAVAYWHHIRSGSAAWARLKPEVRAEMLEQAGAWLRAAEQAGLLPAAAAPSVDYAAVLLDDRGTVWAEVPTSDGREDLLLPLVYAREEASSRRDLADRGARFTHIGWAR